MNCNSCGANTSGLICEFCGALTVESVEDEHEALDEFHRLLHQADEERRGELLKSGFLPRHASSLIEAGFRCMPLLDEDETLSSVSTAALVRLDTVEAKLRALAEQTPEVRRALHEFHQKKVRFRRADRNLTISVLAFFAIVIGCVLFGMYRCVGALSG